MKITSFQGEKLGDYTENQSVINVQGKTNSRSDFNFVSGAFI